jgi:LPXTG-site transpeptidase (sortase) family protein
MVRSSLIIFVSALILIVVPTSFVLSESPLAHVPLPPDTGTQEEPEEDVPAPPSPDFPTKLMIPSVGIISTVEQVGVNDRGEMDVPSGSTSNVGWYKYGTVPGDTGSAVMDAHVYAAFNNLRYLKVGQEIRVMTQAGKTLRFKVTSSRVYALKDVPADKLFNQNDDAHLNLITCAGKFVNSLNTYDHRLVVYATLVD